MTGSFASEFPVQTALSGPAASMAGARYLTGLEDALVIDVGGTTSDIGFLENGVVDVCEEGAAIGSWRTHVKAVDMLTTGLGGDSAIVFDKGLWHIGPERITPFCVLNSACSLAPAPGKTLSSSDHPSRVLQWLSLTGKEPSFTLNSQEKNLMKLLRDGPMMIRDLADVLCQGVWKLVRSERLEKDYCVQRAGLTPTDLYHLQGKMDLWDAPDLESYFASLLCLQKESRETVLGTLENMIARKLGDSVLKKVFPEIPGEGAFSSVVLQQGNRRISLTPKLQIPVIGLGASAPLLLKEAVSRLGGELLLPENGDVANALGAVTSEVSVAAEARIIAGSSGLYAVQGLDHLESRETLVDAEESCLAALVDKTRALGRRAGTSASRVTVHVEDKTAEASGGELLFLERTFRATLSGLPISYNYSFFPRGPRWVSLKPFRCLSPIPSSLSKLEWAKRISPIRARRGLTVRRPPT